MCHTDMPKAEEALLQAVDNKLPENLGSQCEPNSGSGNSPVACKEYF